jgi:hypothetical protein
VVLLKEEGPDEVAGISESDLINSDEDRCGSHCSERCHGWSASRQPAACDQQVADADNDRSRWPCRQVSEREPNESKRYQQLERSDSHWAHRSSPSRKLDCLSGYLLTLLAAED